MIQGSSVRWSLRLCPPPWSRARALLCTSRRSLRAEATRARRHLAANVRLPTARAPDLGEGVTPEAANLYPTFLGAPFPSQSLRRQRQFS